MAKVISVIIPTYNRKQLTDRAVESVKSRYPDSVEIIVVDDGSTELYAYDDELNPGGIDVRVIRSGVNEGAGRARKAGVDAAVGDLIAFLDSDDEYGSSWLDALLHAYSVLDTETRGFAIFAGNVREGKQSHRLVLQSVRTLPQRLKLRAGRTITVIFNPFYTPSIALSKPLCRFSEQLRHCEDYYTMVQAIFRAKSLTVLPDLACVLGRRPNSSGGQSGLKKKMFEGELTVRMEMLKADCVPGGYKILAPLGMMYQLTRALVKLISQAILRLKAVRGAGC